ncbi:hypothetical protein TI04_04015 [Achromatium sp. WMS2]|nr:hypothetical protein TI04_04015 [Achromatium sp. WMS2]
MTSTAAPRAAPGLVQRAARQVLSKAGSQIKDKAISAAQEWLIGNDVINLLPVGVKNTLKQTMLMFGGAMTTSPGNNEVTAIDATIPIRWLFTRAGVGAETFKRWTNLDIHVFVRSDAKVMIYPKHNDYVNLYAIKEVMDVSNKVENSNAVATNSTDLENTTGSPASADSTPEQAPASHLELSAAALSESWESNIGRWFLLNGTGLVNDIRQ